MTDCCKEAGHPSHAAELPKLNRVAGQLEGVKKMIAERRYCPDILTQLRAVRAAVKTIEANIIESHLQSCVADAMSHGNAEDKENKIKEIKEIFKRYEN